MTDIYKNSSDPLQYWIQTEKWRKEYFEQNSQVREDFERSKSSEKLGQSDWLQQFFIKKSFRTMHAFTHLHHFFARKKSSFSLSRKKSQSSFQTSSDQLSREIKNAQYKNSDYAIEFENEGSYMYKSTSGITDINRKLCRTLFKKKQTIPQNTLFRDDLFDEICRKIQNRNETMIIRNIDLLIVPSAQTLAIYDVTHLNHIYETTNEGWNSVFSFSLHKTRSQLDFSVKFGRSAFTQKQWNKLKSFVGEPDSKIIIYFMITTRMYFSFLICEVKCGAAALDIADRQNAHSMNVALKAFVIFFRSVKREKKLDRKIFIFFISHDHRSVKMYDHYSVIEKNKTTFYRHPIREFSFTEQNGRKKWTAHRFIKNVYDHHSLKLHAMICSVINDLPFDINFDFSQSVFFSQSTSQSSQQSNAESIIDENDTQLSFAGSHEITPSSSFTQTNESAFKKPKNQRAGRQWRWCARRVCHDFDELNLCVRMGKPIEAIFEEFRLIIADYYQSVKMHAEIKFFFLYELNSEKLRPWIICFSKSLFFKFHGRLYVLRTHDRLYHKWTLSDTDTF